MQTTLLGLGLALIAAILAAFTAPLFIDWNEWRPQLEAQASALAGSRVTISGNIDLTLLPTPAFVLRNVSLGEAEKGTGMRASEMRGSLSLPALLSGKIEANEFVVSKPSIRLVVEKDGTFLLPAGANAGQDISVSGFVLEAGSLTIEDRRTNAIFLADDFSARGELVSREGPFRIEGGFRLNGARWILRVSSSRFGPDHAGKVRLALERPADRLSFDAEGTLALANSAPRFEGKILAAQLSGTLPWRISSDAAGDAFDVRFANLELALGSSELPITLSGEAKLDLRGSGSLEATLASKRIDLDLGDPKAPANGASHVLPLLREAQLIAGSLPLPAQIAISADGILAGGQLIRDVRANLRVQRGTLVPEHLEAKLPGRAAINFSGKTDGKAFSGPVSFEAEEPQIFARWVVGQEQAERLTLPSALNLQATLQVSLDEEDYGLRDLRASVGGAQLTGSIRRFIFSHPTWTTEINLVARGIDLDTVLPAARTAIALTDEELRANIVVSNGRFLQKPVKRVAAEVRRVRGLEASLSSLQIEDLDGLSLTIKELQGPGSRKEFSVEAVRAEGLATVFAYLTDSADFAALATKYATPHFPLRVTGTLAPEKSGWRAAMKFADAQLALVLGEMKDKKRSAEATLRLPETEISAKGEFRFGADGRFEPVFALNFKSSDLRNAFTLASRASANPIPASGSVNLLREGNNFVFEKLVADLAGSRITGRVAIPAGDVSPFTGALVLDRADARTLLSLALGRAHVSYVELGVPLLANFPGTLKMEIETLSVSERVSLQKAAFQIRAGRYETVFEDFQAQFAGGKLSGSLRVADTYPRVVEIKLNAADFALAQLLAAKALRGGLQGALFLSANGNTEDELIASLSGQGTIALSALEIDRTDATAVTTVFAAAAKENLDDKKIEQALIVALERAALKVSKLEAPLVIANGVLRSGSAKAKAGNIEIALSGSLNLPKQSIETLLAIEVAGEAAAKPGAIIRWEGPFAAPERKIDARALITAITLRAIERGGQNPANMSLPQEERVVPVKKKKAPAKSDIETAPLLPPPANIPSAPQPRSQN